MLPFALALCSHAAADLPPHLASARPPASPHARPHRSFLAPAQVVDVWAELDVPRGTGPRVAQVVAELRTLDGRLAAKSSNAVMLRTEWWSLG